MSPIHLIRQQISKRADEAERWRFGIVKNTPSFTDNLCFWLRTARQIFPLVATALANIPNAVYREQFLNSNRIDPETIGLVYQYGLGDAYMISGLVAALSEANSGRKIVVFSKAKHAAIAELFPGVRESRIIPDRIDTRSIGGSTLLPGRLFYAHFSADLSNFIGFEGLTILDIYKKLFGLSQYTAFQVPRKPSRVELADAVQYVESFGMTPQKTVLIAPETVSTAHDDTLRVEFWLEIVKKLKGRGFDVAINVNKSCNALPGTTALQIPISQLRPVATILHGVIANRSGLCDLLSDLDLRLSIAYPKIRFHGGSLLQAASIMRMWPSTNVCEVEVDKGDFINTVEALLKPFDVMKAVDYRGSELHDRISSQPNT